jgi:hypothetical protein
VSGVGRKKKKKRKASDGQPAKAATSPAKSSRIVGLKRHVAAWIDLYGAGLIALAFALPLLATDELFLGSGTDMVSMEYPLHAFATGWMSEGVLPLWNPYILGGVPFQAGVHGYLYPGSWTGIVLPVGLDIKLGIALHLVLATAGGAWLARGRCRSRLASLFAGVVFGLSAFGVAHLFAGHRVLVATAAWLPWVAGAVDRGVRGQRVHLLTAAVLAGLMLLCGHYQVIYIGCGGLLIYLLLDRLLNPAERGSPLPRTLLGAGRAALVLGLVLVAGALIAAVQIAPMFSTLDLSQRSTGGLDFAASFSSAPPNLLSYLWPNLFGNKVDAPFAGGWSYWESLGYLGLATLALIAFGAAALPWRRSVPALAVIAIGALLALGAHTPLFKVYVAIAPGSDMFRAAGRFCLLTTLFGAFFSGLALDAYLGDRLTNRRRLAGTLAATAVAVLAIAFGSWIGTREVTAWETWLAELEPTARLAGDRLSRVAPDLRALAGDDALKAALITVLAAIALLVGTRQRLRKAAGAALLILLVVDLFHFGQRFMKTAPAQRFEWPDRIEEILTRAGPSSRALTGPELHAPNHPMLAGASSAAGYDIFLDGRYAKYLNRAAGRDDDVYLSYVHVRRYSRMIDHLGVEHLLTGAPLNNGANRRLRGYGNFERVKRVERIHVYRHRSPTPRAMVVHRAERVDDEEQILEQMAGHHFDPTEVALVEADVGRLEPPGAGAVERARITVYEPNRVEVEVEAAAVGLLVLSDTLHPGWSATVDGKEAPIHRANYVMRAVPVPAGSHTVVMTYMPTGFVVGAIVSLASILALIGFAYYQKRRKRGR